jgi:hypothetical protein
MADFDFKYAKQAIAEINAIVETCPEALREKCFELLYGSAFGQVPAFQQNSSRNASENVEKEREETPPKAPALDQRKLPGNVLAFARRYSLSQPDIEKLFMLDHEPILPVYKINSSNSSKAQLQKVLMVLLENALLSNQFKAPYAEIRDSCKEDGLYDSNFNKALKRQHDLFKGAIYKDAIKEDETVELTGPGSEKLAEVVKELGQLSPAS